MQKACASGLGFGGPISRPESPGAGREIRELVASATTRTGLLHPRSGPQERSPPGANSASPIGPGQRLYDMSGNIAEWTSTTVIVGEATHNKMRGGGTSGLPLWGFAWRC